MIRAATEADIERIVEFGAQLHAESRFARLPYSVDKCRALAASMVAEPDGHCALIAERGGEPIGVMLGFIDEHFFTDARVASDVMLYIVPQCRGGLAGPRLLDHFTAWALSKQVEMVEIGISTGVNVEASTRLYQRLGYRPVGIVFELED